MKMNPCKKCGGEAILHGDPKIGVFEAYCTECLNNTQRRWWNTLEDAVEDWNDENPIEPATICPQCGATNRPVEWEEALDILRSAMQRKLTER
jgi:Zn finger protein HypA/HybF involved in hydrogenase expression